MGEWWTLLILHDAFDGYTRFDQFQQNLGISSSMLTRRSRPCPDGLLERRRYQTSPPATSTSSPSSVARLRPVIVALAAWGNSRPGAEERSMILVDAASGEEVEPVLVDRSDRAPLDDADFVFAAGPAAASPAMRGRYQGRIPAPDRDDDRTA